MVLPAAKLPRKAWDPVGLARAVGRQDLAPATTIVVSWAVGHRRFRLTMVNLPRGRLSPVRVARCSEPGSQCWTKYKHGSSRSS